MYVKTPLYVTAIWFTSTKQVEIFQCDLRKYLVFTHGWTYDHRIKRCQHFFIERSFAGSFEIKERRTVDT